MKNTNNFWLRMTLKRFEIGGRIPKSLQVVIAYAIVLFSTGLFIFLVCTGIAIGGDTIVEFARLVMDK